MNSLLRLKSSIALLALTVAVLAHPKSTPKLHAITYHAGASGNWHLIISKIIAIEKW
jgi:hypothetical protein